MPRQLELPRPDLFMGSKTDMVDAAGRHICLLDVRRDGRPIRKDLRPRGAEMLVDAHYSRQGIPRFVTK